MGLVTIQISSKPSNAGASRHKAVRIYPVSGWIVPLILAPLFIALACFCVVFFLTFFPLLVFSLVMLALWVGWLCWTLNKSNVPKFLAGDYSVIGDTQSIHKQREVNRKQTRIQAGLR